MTDVPFMQHIRHATEITDGYPYKEIAEFCKVHRDKVERVFDTISYVDGLNFAARATAPALYSVALMDDICPPSTVFASFNHYAGPKEIEVYPYNGHEGGGAHQVARALEFAASVVGEQCWQRREPATPPAPTPLTRLAVRASSTARSSPVTCGRRQDPLQVSER